MGDARQGTDMLFLSKGQGPFALSREAHGEAESKRAAAWIRMHAEMLEAGGVAVGQGRDHREEGASIAINSRERLILLRADGVYKSYDFEDVREWWWGIEPVGIVAEVGQARACMDTRANPCEGYRGDESPCLFVSVRDREIATWRVSMSDKTVAALWMEILREELSGNLVAERR